MTRENAVLEHRAMEKVEKGRQPRLLSGKAPWPGVLGIASALEFLKLRLLVL